MSFFIGHFVFEQLDQSPVNRYLFDKTSFKLLQIRSADNTTFVTVDHSSNQISDNVGNSVKIFYGDNGFIIQLQLYKKSALLHSVR